MRGFVQPCRSLMQRRDNLRYCGISCATQIDQILVVFEHEEH